MYTVYRLNVDELNHQFIEALQTLFKDREVEITVSDVDETAYLMQSEPNRKRLLQAVQNITMISTFQPHRGLITDRSQPQIIERIPD